MIGFLLQNFWDAMLLAQFDRLPFEGPRLTGIGVALGLPT